MQTQELRQMLEAAKVQYRRLLEQALKDSEGQILELLQRHPGELTLNLQLQAGPKAPTESSSH